MILYHYKLSRCTSNVPRSALSRRGTAEIEMILICTILITLLMLAMGAMRIGVARLGTTASASFQAFNDATASGNPQFTGDAAVPPIDGVDTIRPGFPNRVSDPTASANPAGGTGMAGVGYSANVGFQAAAISPTWNYSGFPVGSDQTFNSQWLTSYVDESHANLYVPLGLAPAWTP